jgi:hypothetical protein
MKLLAWSAIALIIVVFVLSHGERRWSDNAAGRLTLVLLFVMAVLAIAKGCG